MKQRGGLRTVAHPQRADALGAVNLVGGDGDEIGLSRNLDSSEPLDGIAQHQRAGLVRHARDLGDWLDHADLVVDQHDRDQQHALVELALEIVEVDAPIMLDRQNGEVDAAPGQPLAGVEHRRMLGRDRDDAVALSERSRPCP